MRWNRSLASIGKPCAPLHHSRSDRALPLAGDDHCARAIRSDFNLAVPMRDGVNLSANIFRPGAPGRYPAILLRTPYNKGDAITVAWQSFVNHGYAVVVEDVRGRYDSGGKFEPINQEVNDGDDTLNWIARQAGRTARWECTAALTSGSRSGRRRWRTIRT